MIRNTFWLILTSAVAFAEVNVPDGTRVRVRLDQNLKSETADEGQIVELSVVEAVKIDDTMAIPEGSRVTGTITMAQSKRRMGRAGKLDFSIDRVRMADGEWVPLRYEINRKSGDSHAVRTGVLTAGMAAVFWPAAPLFLLMHGKDVTINKGVQFDVFTDNNHELRLASAAPAKSAPVAAHQPAAGSAVTITSDLAGAEIEVDGAFIGSTPTTVQLAGGTHQIAVRHGAAQWQRSLLVNGGSTVNVNAILAPRATPVAVRR